jgi:hypothetical protein
MSHPKIRRTFVDLRTTGISQKDWRRLPIDQSPTNKFSETQTTTTFSFCAFIPRIISEYKTCFFAHNSIFSGTSNAGRRMCGHEVCKTGKYHEHATFAPDSQSIFKHEGKAKFHLECPITCDVCIRRKEALEKDLEKSSAKTSAKPPPGKTHHCQHDMCHFASADNIVMAHEKNKKYHTKCTSSCRGCHNNVTDKSPPELVQKITESLEKTADNIRDSQVNFLSF